MARKNTADELLQLIDNLRRERQEHVSAIEQIDKTFQRLGIDADAAPATPARRRKAGRTKAAGRTKTTRAKTTKRSTTTKKTAKKSGRRTRRSFEQTGEESVLNFVKQHGNPSAAEVNAHWTEEGRGGKANNTLTRLVQEGKLKRVEIEGERGGRYQVA